MNWAEHVIICVIKISDIVKAAHKFFISAIMGSEWPAVIINRHSITE